MSNFPTANELIAEDLMLRLRREDISTSIRSRVEGYLKVFVRNQKVQKINFIRSSFESDEIFDESSAYQPEIIPPQVYKRFCYALTTCLTYEREPIEYGYLHFKYKFEQTNDSEWIDYVSLVIEDEIHFKN